METFYEYSSYLHITHTHIHTHIDVLSHRRTQFTGNVFCMHYDNVHFSVSSNEQEALKLIQRAVAPPPRKVDYHDPVRYLKKIYQY